MKERITITLEKNVLSQVDAKVDGTHLRNRSHVIEQLLSRSLQEQHIDTAVLLAGGKGTRLRPFTYEMPKAMIPLQGKPLIEHIITHLKRFGVEHIILSVGYKADKIISHFGNGRAWGLDISYVTENEPLGTAGPLRLAEDQLPKTFLMLNGDILSRVDVNDFTMAHKDNKTVASLVLTTMDDPSRYGVANLKGNKIMGFVEKPKKSEAPSNLINAGFYCLEKSVLDYIPDGYAMVEKNVFPILAQEGKLSGYVYNGPWFDLGTTESYEAAIKGWKP